MRCFVLTAWFLCFFGVVRAQMNARIPITDSFGSATPELVQPTPDSTRVLVIKKSTLPLGKKGIWSIQKGKSDYIHQWYFYYVFLVIVFFALLKQLYPRYLNDLFRVFLRTSLKANQIKEQLVASVWQSFLLNILFFLSGGYYLFLLFDFFNLNGPETTPLILVLCTGLLAGLYTVKMIFLRFTGWLLQVVQPADTYIFIVFLMNKVLGILLLPFSIIITYAPTAIAHIAVSLSLAMIGALLIYRSLLGLQTGSAISKMSKFHFFLYVLSIEIIPIMVIFRVFLDVF